MAQARVLDGSGRKGFVDNVESFFQICLRLFPKEPLTVLAVAVAVQSVFAFWDDEQALSTPKQALAERGETICSESQVEEAGLSRKARGRKPTELMNVMAHARCRRLYTRCRRLDPIGYYHAVTANEKVFRDIFAAKRVVLVERNKTFKPPGQSGYDAKGKFMPSSPKTAPSSPRADIRAIVIVSLVNFRMVVSVVERIGEDGLGRRYLPEIVLHEDEVRQCNESLLHYHALEHHDINANVLRYRWLIW